MTSHLVTIKVLTNLRVILAIVGILGGDLDCIDVGMFGGICRPLNRRSRPTDACGNTMEELELGNEEVVELFIAFPNLCFGVEDGLLILTEDGKYVGYFYECVTVD